MTAKTPASASHLNPSPPLIHFNMCGEACNSGSTGAVVNDIAFNISHYRAQWVTLNESCAPQVDAIISRLQSAYGLTYKRKFATTVSLGGACGSYGIAVIWRDLLTQGSSYTNTLSGTPGRETRKLLCQELGVSTFYVCTTHLEASPTYIADRRQQGKEVGQWMDFNLKTAGRASVIGGDFNDSPTSQTLDYMFGIGCTGSNIKGNPGMWEGTFLGCSRTAAYVSTKDSGGKIDYVFFHPEEFQTSGGQVTATPYSDHRYVIAFVGR